MDGGNTAELTDVLGPHPLLAEALHVRLSEAGLARADRARLFTVTTAADGIILATVGGEEAVQAARITGMLLAARLAVPVIAAALDQEGSIASVAEQLRAAGSEQLALAPYLIGPELAEGSSTRPRRRPGAPPPSRWAPTRRSASWSSRSTRPRSASRRSSRRARPRSEGRDAVRRSTEGPAPVGAGPSACARGKEGSGVSPGRRRRPPGPRSRPRGTGRRCRGRGRTR